MRNILLNLRPFILLAVVFAGPLVWAAELDSAHTLVLYTRSRVEDPQDSGQFKIVYETVRWDARKTAVVICDMWQRHWCKGATSRGAEMAPRMDKFVDEARKRGVLIVHAPCGGVKFYEDHPARQRAKNAPKVANLPDPIPSGVKLLPSEEKRKWPIDQSDGGCDEPTKCNDPMDRHQTNLLTICDEDAITSSCTEFWNLFEQRNIENVILVGVHTNICVIGRPFGLRNMVRFGKNVLLVRDMTDTMYNSRKAPYVSHIRGTELIVEHIEKFVCPTITSSDLLGGPALRFKQDKRPHVVFIVSDDHYHADKTIPPFAQMLREQYGCYCTVLHGQGKADIPAIEELKSADVMVLYIRRLALPKEQLDTIRTYLSSGKPMVALRTANHAFATHYKEPKDYKTPEGRAEWRGFDAEILGGNYHGHGSNKLGTDVAVVPQNSDHPILAGLRTDKWHSVGSLYLVSPINQDATVLLTGSIQESTEPVAWIRSYNGGRVFYAALGHEDDFKQPQFCKLLVNAIYWAMDKSLPDKNTVSKAKD